MDKLLNLLELHFPNLKNGDNNASHEKLKE